jgi:hypothetical protein
VGTVTKLRDVRPRYRGSIPNQGQEFYPLSRGYSPSLAQLSFLFSTHIHTVGYFAGVKRPSREADHSSCFLPWSRISTAIHPLQNTPSLCVQGKIQFTFTPFRYSQNTFCHSLGEILSFASINNLQILCTDSLC